MRGSQETSTKKLLHLDKLHNPGPVQINKWALEVMVGGFC